VKKPAPSYDGVEGGEGGIERPTPPPGGGDEEEIRKLTSPKRIALLKTKPGSEEIKGRRRNAGSADRCSRGRGKEKR